MTDIDIYRPPESDVSVNHEKSLWLFDRRDWWILVPLGCYVFWQLVDYVYYYLWTVNNLEFYRLLFLSINIPVYISLCLFVFGVRVKPRLFWKIWVVVAIIDEIRMLVLYFDTLQGLLLHLADYAPVYAIAALYAYRSPLIWKQTSLPAKN